MHLGYDVSWATMARVLTKAGIEPAPKRGMGMTKAEFLESHWSLMVQRTSSRLRFGWRKD